MEVGIDIGALRTEPPGAMRRPGHVLCRQREGRRPRFYQQTFIDTYAVARPLPSQATSAQLAEAKAPLRLACAG